ncbi:MAG TPA: PAS domain S-box protein [Brevundimonas sp.]
MFGYAAGELVGRHVSTQNAYPALENARKVEAVIAELKRNGVWRGEWLNRRKDGSIFTSRSRITAVDVEGRTYWLCLQEDVTEEKAAVAALAESQARLQLATDAAAIGIWDWDVLSGRMNYSAEAKAICGFAPDQDVTFQGARRVTHPDDYPRTAAMARRALDPLLRERLPYEYRVVRSDGEVRWVLAHGEAVFADVNGELQAVRYVGTLQDITDRRRLEDAERAGRARLALAIEAGRMAVWELEIATDKVTGSPELNRLLGFPEDADPTAEEMRARYYAGEEERLRAVGEAALARGERVIDAEYRYVWPDGTVRWLWLRAEFTLDQAGAPSHAVGVLADITERRRSEEAMRAGEARLALAQRAAGFGVWDWLLDTGEINWSPEMFHINGLDPVRDAVSPFDAWLRVLHPDDKHEASQAAQRAASHGDPFNIEFRIVHPDTGETRWVRSQAVAVLDADGKPSRLVGVNVDITEDRRREEALRSSNDRLQGRVAEALAERNVLADIVEGTDAFVQVLDPDFRWVAINKASADEFERIYGVRPEVGASILDLLADKPEHQSAVREIWARALAGEEFSETGEYGDPALDRRHYEMKYNVLRDADGRQIGAYQFVYDVTERVREQHRLIEAEAARRRSDALYRTYFENTPEALFIVGVTPDDDFLVEEINPAHEAGVGLKFEDIQGKRVADILPEAAANRILETYRHVLRTGRIYQYREVFELDGEKRHWDTSLVPMRNDQGRIIRLIGASRDVTPQVQAEEALRQSQKMEAMGQLTGGVAHDFNNLLTPIVGSLDMLQRKGLGGPREQRLIHGAIQSAERARVLVQRLLSFARRQPLQPTAVDIGRLVEGMGELLASVTGPQIEVIFRVAPELPPARADANQVEMALLNLGVNARDAMPNGGVLTVSAELDEVGEGNQASLAAGQYIRLSVADTGAGMDEATVQRAIEPFFSTKGIGRGTGLGLSMVHGLASQLGGALSIQSQVGLGTDVSLWLPLGEGQAVEAADVDARPVASAPAGAVLLVDDEELVRLSTADMLVELGYEVIEADSADSALQMLQQGLRPGLLVTDHLMPGLTGADFARVAREMQPELAALVITGYAEVEGLAPDLPRLTKPFNISELAASIASLTAASTRTRQRPRPAV